MKMEFLLMSSGYEDSLFSESSLPSAGSELLSSLTTAKAHVGLAATRVKSEHDLAAERNLFETHTALGSFDDALAEPDWMTEKMDFGILDLEALIGAYKVEDSHAEEPALTQSPSDLVMTPATDIEFLHTLVGGEDPAGDPQPEYQALAQELMLLTPVSLDSRSPAALDSGTSSPTHSPLGLPLAPSPFSEPRSPFEELLGPEEVLTLAATTSSSPPLQMVVTGQPPTSPAAVSGKRMLDEEALLQPAIKRARRPPGSSGHTPNKREKKKDQNKQAATRYRQKKKIEGQSLQEEHLGLEKKNKQLKETVQSIEKEIDCLKSIMIDLYKVRKAK